MTFMVLGVCLALAGFAAVNFLVSAVVAAAWPSAHRLLRVEPARRRAGLIFALRLAPAAVSLTVTAVLLVPAYVRFEPRETSEPISPVLLVLALAGGWLLASALREGVRSIAATRRLVKDWLALGRPVSIAESPVRAYCVPHTFPVIAVVGVVRPRLFVASGVLEELEPGERAAVLAHEAAHLGARDNLKRLAVSCAPDWLAWMSTGARLRRAWDEAAEAAADARAARSRPGATLDLAAALVKVGRMAPPGSRLAVPATALHTGADLGRRVRRLLVSAKTRPEPESRVSAGLIVGFVASAFAAIVGPVSLREVYGLLEFLVRLLA